MAFIHCPTCKRKGRTFTTRNIYECRDCGQKFCHDCNRGKCPGCGSTRKRKIGFAK